MIGKVFQFIGDPQNSFGKHTQDFVILCVVAIAFAMIISIPLGVAVARRPSLAFLATNLTGLMRAIPIIVFLAVAVSIPGLGIGFRPAVIALIVLGIPPILLNTIAALRGIDPAAIEAARGMGMTRWQILSRIELPLSLPIVIAGIRTSAVQIIATATIAGLIGAGGYGEYIQQGFFQFDDAQIIAGAGSVAVIALITEYGLAFIQRFVTPAGVRTSNEATSDAANASVHAAA